MAWDKPYCWSEERTRRYPTFAQPLAAAVPLPDTRPDWLAPQHWRWLVAHVVERRTYWDLATASGVTRSTVQYHVQKALRQIHQHRLANSP